MYLHDLKKKAPAQAMYDTFSTPPAPDAATRRSTTQGRHTLDAWEGGGHGEALWPHGGEGRDNGSLDTGGEREGLEERFGGSDGGDRAGSEEGGYELGGGEQVWVRIIKTQPTSTDHKGYDGRRKGKGKRLKKGIWQEEGLEERFGGSRTG